MRRSNCEPGLWTPGVSTKTICAAGCESRRAPLRAGTSTTPAMRLRVVCGLAETMATFSPIRALSSVLLPELGRPRMATNPDFKGFSCSRLYYCGFAAPALVSSAYDPHRHDRAPHPPSAGTRRCGRDSGAFPSLGDRALSSESRSVALPERRCAYLLPRDCAAQDGAGRGVALDAAPAQRAGATDRTPQPDEGR